MLLGRHGRNVIAGRKEGCHSSFVQRKNVDFFLFVSFISPFLFRAFSLVRKNVFVFLRPATDCGFNRLHCIMLCHFLGVLSAWAGGLHALLTNEIPSFASVAKSIDSRRFNICQDDAPMFFAQQSPSRHNVHFQTTDEPSLPYFLQSVFNLLFRDRFLVRHEQLCHSFHVLRIVEIILHHIHTFLSDLCHFFRIPPQFSLQFFKRYCLFWPLAFRRHTPVAHCINCRF
mmetsp:Transcript_355/g.710  ORF Transcript_355/g.710 Transcript_355/m.710 type:complete len:228 (+) Transcript_355:254-937(+)